MADDIVQSATTKILARVRAEGLEVDYGAGYLWKVANHAVIDEIRRRQRRLEEPSERTDDASAPRGAADEGERRARILAGVRECLSQARPDRRAALGLYLQGMKLREVALSLRVQPKRADNLVHRGLAALRRCLDGKGLRP
jgi:RNA polymerase sigma factor (sigma-70 family)